VEPDGAQVDLITTPMGVSRASATQGNRLVQPKGGRTERSDCFSTCMRTRRRNKGEYFVTSSVFHRSGAPTDSSTAPPAGLLIGQFKSVNEESA